MKNVKKIIVLKQKFSSRTMMIFTMGQMRASETDAVYKLIHASATNHFNYDALGTSYATAQMRNNTLIILKIQD
jgi:hypothetical protein